MNKIRVFSNGSEFMNWRDRNCNDCKFDYDGEKSHCKFEKALAFASVDDGEVKEELINEYTGGFSEKGFLKNCIKKNLDPIEEADPRQVTLEDVCGG